MNTAINHGVHAMELVSFNRFNGVYEENICAARPLSVLIARLGRIAFVAQGIDRLAMWRDGGTGRIPAETASHDARRLASVRAGSQMPKLDS